MMMLSTVVTTKAILLIGKSLMNKDKTIPIKDQYSNNPANPRYS